MGSIITTILGPFIGPAAIAGVVLAILGGVYIAGDVHGRKIANANCEARVQAAIQALHAKEDLAAKTADAEENKEAASDEASEKTLEKKNEALAAKVSVAPCLTGHDADLVRGAWGIPIPHPKPSIPSGVTKRLKKVLHKSSGSATEG